MTDKTTQPREQAGIDLDKLIAKLEVIAQVVDGENLPNTANALRGIAADLTPQSAPEAQKAVAIVTGSSVQWLEGAGKLADRSPLYASPVAAPEAPTLTQRLNTPDQIDAYARQLAMSLWRTHYRTMSPEFELLDDTYGVLSQVDNMLTGLVLASTGAAPEAPASEQQAGEPTCAMCNDSGIVGYPPDQYEECPDCIKARAATTASASGERVIGGQRWSKEAEMMESWSAPAPSRNAAPVGPALRDLARKVVESLGWTINGTFVITKSGDELHTADAISFVRAALTQQSAAQAPSRDAILETAVQAVSDRVGDADKVSIVGVYEAIRALKANRHALPESCSAATEQGEKS